METTNCILRHGWFTLSFALLLAIGFGCGGGVDSSGSGVAGTFTASGTSAGANIVRLRAVSADRDLVGIEVAIGGTTTSNDLYAFGFDIVLSDSAVAKYVTGSATIGSALTLAGSQTSSVQVSQVGSHLVVGVTKLGGGLGNGVPSGESVVVAFKLQALRAGTTSLAFAGTSSPQNPTNDPAALDHDLNVVTSVRFDGIAASVTGR